MAMRAAIVSMPPPKVLEGEVFVGGVLVAVVVGDGAGVSGASMVFSALRAGGANRRSFDCASCNETARGSA